MQWVLETLKLGPHCNFRVKKKSTEMLSKEPLNNDR
jgi:hypothetical protein